MGSDFRRFIPPHDVQRCEELRTSDIYQWTDLRCSEPFVRDWIKHWQSLLSEPYRGISNDGTIRDDIHYLADEHDYGAPVEAMVLAARKVIEVARLNEQQRLTYPVDAEEWRRWSNPELYTQRHGIRLEESSEAFVQAVLGLMEASLSPVGFGKAVGCMKTNKFLGQVVNGVKVLNENAYNFAMFGEPSHKAPWGWQLFGHHLDINCLVVGRQMVIAPVFMGSEPNIIDDGPDKGLVLFTDQEELALALLKSFDVKTLAALRVYDTLGPPEIPTSRWHRADQRHLGGAFQDNRIIPYEGIRVEELTKEQQAMIRELIRLSINFLPSQALEAELRKISTTWHETYFCWIGGISSGDAFYYKIQSPAIMIEFDHHTGVFLTNKEPMPFHIHTLVRACNGNDYGRQLVKAYFERSRTVQ